MAFLSLWWVKVLMSMKVPIHPDHLEWEQVGTLTTLKFTNSAHSVKWFVCIPIYKHGNFFCQCLMNVLLHWWLAHERVFHPRVDCGMFFCVFFKEWNQCNLCDLFKSRIIHLRLIMSALSVKWLGDHPGTSLRILLTFMALFFFSFFSFFLKRSEGGNPQESH